MKQFNTTGCYDHPRYWDLAFDDETTGEADFIEAAARKYCPFPLRRILEPGCGGGRLLAEMALRGYEVIGCDVSAAAVEYCRTRLPETQPSCRVEVADMLEFRSPEPVDVACCFVNTFRHLLTETDAVRHLNSVADSLRAGGLYLIGMHLLPPDADEEDEEEWTAEADGVRIDMRLQVTSCSRLTRLETLRFEMQINDNGARHVVTSEYPMRIYRADQFQSLLSKVPRFRLLDVYDFWYDIEDPLQLSDELGDTVVVLQKLDAAAESTL
ncbi:MAG: class I SAM-dependent methyltransferase [Planctomycetaceae bacterium]